jgi:hypothetical protein
MATDTSAWAAEHSAALVGLPAAAAEQEVEDAGLRARIAGPDVLLTLEFRTDRITLLTDDGGIVIEVRAG